MSLCFSHSISSSFTPTYKGLFTFFHHLHSRTLPSHLDRRLLRLLFLNSFLLLFRHGYGNISVEICHQFLTTFSTLLLKFFRYLALPIRRPIFLTLDTLKNFSILESYFRHLCNSPFWFLRGLLSCLSRIYVSLTLFVPLSLYRFSKIQISKLLIVVSTRSLEKLPMISNDRSI